MSTETKVAAHTPGPEMLEALEEALMIFQNEFRRHPDDSWWKTCAERAEAVIAKARGAGGGRQGDAK